MSIRSYIEMACNYHNLMIQQLSSKHRVYSKSYSLKDGKPLAEDGRVAVNKDGGPNGSYEITIKKVQAGDAGTYSVVATNSFGKAECSAKIGCKGTIFQLQFFTSHFLKYKIM